jgi:hypothetical protein
MSSRTIIQLVERTAVRRRIIVIVPFSLHSRTLCESINPMAGRAFDGATLSLAERSTALQLTSAWLSSVIE